MNKGGYIVGQAVMTILHKSGPVQVAFDSHWLGRPVSMVQNGLVDVSVNQTPLPDGRVQIAFRYDLEESLLDILHFLRVAEAVCRFGKKVKPADGLEEKVASTEENPIWNVGRGQLPTIFSGLPTVVPLIQIAEVICFCLSKDSRPATCNTCSLKGEKESCPIYPDGARFCLTLRSLPTLAARLPLQAQQAVV